MIPRCPHDVSWLRIAMGKQSFPEILRGWISAWILLALQTLELRRMSIPQRTNTKKWIHQLLRKFHSADSQTPDSAWVPASPGVPSFGSRWWTRCHCQYRHGQDGGSGGGSHDCWAAPRVVACQHCSPVSPLEFLTLGKRGKAQFLHVLVKMLLNMIFWMIFPLISPEPALLPQSRLIGFPYARWMIQNHAMGLQLWDIKIWSAKRHCLVPLCKGCSLI